MHTISTNAAALALTVWVLVGCGGAAEFNRNAGVEAFPPFEGQVEVLRQFPAGDDFVRLGVVSAQGGAVARQSGLIDDMKEQAARHGADAIVLQSEMRAVRGMDGTTHKMAAFAIRRSR